MKYIIRISMFNGCTIIILALLLLSVPCKTFCQSVYVKHYTTNDGLAGNHVYMCHQDNNGYLWIATNSGLSRFDGRKFKTYGHEDGLSDNEVLFVTNDAYNNIWVKTFSANSVIAVIKGTPGYINHHSITSVPVEYYTVSDEMYSHSSKTTYLSGGGSLVLIKNRKVLMSRQPLTGGSPVFETEDGKFFSGDGNNLYLLNDTSASLFQTLDISQPYSRLCYYKGLLYVLTGKVIKLYTYKQQKFIHLSTTIFKENINLIHVNKFGVWVTFVDKMGLYKYKDAYLKSGHTEIKVAGIVNHIMTDKEDGVWISTTDNGVFCIPYPDVQSYTADNGLSSSVIYTLDPITANTFWVGYNTGNAELLHLQNGTVDIKRSLNLGPHKISNDIVVDIAHNNTGSTFFLSRNRLVTLDGKNILPKSGANKSMLVINDSILGIGSWHYVLLNLRTLKPDTHRIGRIYAQAKDSDGSIWLGGIKGLYRLSHAASGMMRKFSGLDNIRINALAVDGKYVWAGTQNHGLYLIKDDEVVLQLTDRNLPALPSNTIKALAVKNAELWIGTNRGILQGIFNYSTLQFDKHTFFDHKDGLLSPEINDIKVFDSTVLIATYDGVTALEKHNRRSKINYIISDIFVRKQGDTNEIRGDSSSFRYSTKGIEIGLQTAALKYGSDVTYRYMLKPFDNTWKTTGDNLIQYTNIPPGDYIFIVTAFDRRGNSSLSAYRYIQIKPLFRQTIWFKSLIFLGILLLAAILIYWYLLVTKKRTDSKLLQGRMIAKARLEALRAQLKPHFIFNSLNAINDYIYNNKNDDAANLLHGFAGFIRKGLHLADKDYTSIAEEVNFLKQYLELEKLKCDNCFDYVIEVQGNIATIVIPSLITQPFVENAVIHGLRNVRNERAMLCVTYSLKDNDVVCSIVDNGVGIKQSLLHKKDDVSKGTMISKERINYFKTGLGIDIELDIKDLSDIEPAKHGTLITLIIKNILNSSGYETTN